MQISAEGRKFVESFEGLKLTAYRDGNNILTIGYGHTPAIEGQTCTQVEADELLANDLCTAENCMQHLLAHIPLNQNQIDALGSFIFNLGCNHFEGSTVYRDLEARDYAGAANSILLWDKIAGNVSPGLLRRREAERALFLKPC